MKNETKNTERLQSSMDVSAAYTASGETEFCWTHFCCTLATLSQAAMWRLSWCSATL